MKHQRSIHSVARVIAFVALNLVMIASVGAQRQEREATVAGRDVTIQVTVHPHNDRARAAAAQFQADDFTVREEKRPQRIISVKRPGDQQFAHPSRVDYRLQIGATSDRPRQKRPGSARRSK